MKKSKLLLFVLLMSIAVSSVSADDYNMLDGLGRGFANITLGWLEIPRGLTYYSVEYPVIGVIPGVMQGAGMTVVRTVGGLVDFITLGFLRPGNTVYDGMDEPLYPWQAPWLPTEEEEEEE